MALSAVENLAELKRGDLVRILRSSDCPTDWVQPSVSDENDIGMFIGLNQNSWPTHPVLDIYIKGAVAAYSAHLIKKI